MTLGLGGATLSDILFFRFLRDGKVSSKEAEVLHTTKNIIMSIIVLIVLSGVALFFSNTQKYLHSPMFLLKATITTVVIINGFALHHLIAPHFLRLNLTSIKDSHTRLRRLAFALGAISVTSWYAAFFVAMLKTEMPFSYLQGLSIYIVIVIIAITGSQIMADRMTRKHSH
jgi:hypothetical protein